MKRLFYGWRVAAAAVLTFGFAVGLPYYNIPFFYDYFEKTFGWTKAQITLGFPLAALPTILIGPLVIHRFSPRKLILAGTALTFLAFLGFGTMGGNIWVYWGLWLVYAAGYMFSGPIPHQAIVSQWFRKNRGKAMGLLYAGAGLIGSLGSFLVKPLTEFFNRPGEPAPGGGFHSALVVMGAMTLLAWPLAIFVIRDRPSDKGLCADGAAVAPAEAALQPLSFQYLLTRFSFWLLLIGSFCSIASIGAVNVHMKFVFLDRMSTGTNPNLFQTLLNSTWRAASMIILISSIAGRLVIGAFADCFPKKWVMVASYFITAATIPILLRVTPPATPWTFALLFGVVMGADYMMIPLMAAEQFGVNTLGRAMALILPANLIGQTWFPYFVSLIRQEYGNYTAALGTVFVVSLAGALAIALLPRREREGDTLPAPGPPQAAANG